MGRFYDTVDAQMIAGKATEEQIREVISMLDTQILEPLMHNKPREYWRFMRDMHEVHNGCHYDDIFARWEVAQMQHTASDSTICKGEHWTMEQVTEIYNANKARLQQRDAVCDLYVALHSWWHDNIEHDRADFADDAEQKNIARGIAYFFGDEDAPEGKIWRYYKGMRAECN